MIERIRYLCKQKGTNFSKLEKELGFANGSLAKTKPEAVQASRVYTLAKYFNVSMEYLMDGSDVSTSNYGISNKEYEMILKFRAISEESKRAILSGLESAYSFATEKKEGQISNLLEVG